MFLRNFGNRFNIEDNARGIAYGFSEKQFGFFFYHHFTIKYTRSFIRQNIFKQLIALASSLSAGCKYCQAHTSHGAERAGIEEKKIADILNYSESEKFSNSEKAVLDLAFAAGKVPNNSNQEHFDNLSKYYSKKEIVDIVSVISLFGFLNRWNDTLGTALEEVPESFVNNKLKPLGWI